MDQERKMQVATFRFGVISDFVGGARLSRGERERLLREKSDRAWEIPFSGRPSAIPSSGCRFLGIMMGMGRPTLRCGDPEMGSGIFSVPAIK